MNRRSSGSLALSKAVIGFSNFKTAEGLTDRSIDFDKRDLNQWVTSTGDVDVAHITR